MCLLLLATPALAQQRTAPPSAPRAASEPATQRAAHFLPLDEVARVEMPALDNDALIARDEAARLTAEPGPFRFAEPFEVGYDARTAGTWETLGDGTRVWRLVVRSPGAYSINLGFTRFRLPEDASLWLYPAGEAPHFRPFTAADNEAHGQLWTPIVRGDEVVVELDLPPAKPGAAADYELSIGQVNHAYRPFGVRAETAEDQARSGSCHVDVVCPEGDGHRDVIRGVGAYTRGGIQNCSGSAINNTAGDGTPYFLTANHCGVTAADAATVVIYWNYENSTCRPVGSPENASPGDGPLFQFNSGAILRGRFGASDWALLETDDPIPTEYNVFLNGWDRRDQATSSAVGIHHPNLEEKRISVENDSTTVVTGYQSGTPNPNGTHLRITEWDLGVTEVGSSGSPLFSPEKRIVGQLHGADVSSCEGLSDWYGRMARNMTTGLAEFLDPGGSGVPFIDGLEAGDPSALVQILASMTASPASVSPGGTTRITVEVFNNGSEPAEAVAFEDEVAGSLTFAGNLSASSGTASEAGGVVTWAVDVGPGSSETVSFSVAVNADAPVAPITHTALVTHPSLAIPPHPGVVIDVFAAPDYYYTNDSVVGIPDDACGTPIASEIEVPESLELVSMKVGVNVYHPDRGDLRIQLTNPQNRTVRLLQRVGSARYIHLDALFSDSGPAGAFSVGHHMVEAPFYDVEGRTQGQGAGPLAGFLGDDPQGTWTLRICDEGLADVGSLRRWALFFYRAEVYDALGRRVTVLHDGPVAAGAEQELRLDGRGLAGGVYVVRFTGEAFTASRKVLLVK